MASNSRDRWARMVIGTRISRRRYCHERLEVVR